LQDIELARISQQASCQTSQPERQLRSSDELATERLDDNGQLAHIGIDQSPMMTVHSMQAEFFD
jgi:hypothetical protein